MSLVFEAYTAPTVRGGNASARLPRVRSAASGGLTGLFVIGTGRLGFGGHATFGTSGRGAIPRLRGHAGVQGAGSAVGFVPGFGGAASGFAFTPAVTVGSAAVPLLAGQGVGHIRGTASQSAGLPRLRALSGAIGSIIGVAALPQLRARGGAAIPSENFLFLMQSGGFVEAISSGAGGPIISATSTLALVADADTGWIMVRRSLLALAAGMPVALLDAVEQARETLVFEDVAGIVWAALYQQGLALGATAMPSMRVLVEVGEALALAAGGGHLLDGLEAVVAAMELGQAAAYVWPGSVLESIALAGGGAAGLLAISLREERMALDATVAGRVMFAALVPETLVLGEVASSTAELLDRIAEGAVLLATIHLPDGQYLAWVCNTESRAFTTYRNFPFNSFCELGGHYYGATDEGIYLLEGDDDAGVPIDAHVRGGLMDMGTGKLKRQEALYLGYRATDQLLLKVVTTSEDGEKTESWYSLDAQPTEAMREGRIKIGKGLKSVYWGFEVANVDGGDFDLDTIAWLPMVLDRRITNG